MDRVLYRLMSIITSWNQVDCEVDTHSQRPSLYADSSSLNAPKCSTLSGDYFRAQLNLLRADYSHRQTRFRFWSVRYVVDVVPWSAALITSKLIHRKVADLGWQWGKHQYQVWSYFVPLFYSLIADC